MTEVGGGYPIRSTNQYDWRRVLYDCSDWCTQGKGEFWKMQINLTGGEGEGTQDDCIDMCVMARWIRKIQISLLKGGGGGNQYNWMCCWFWLHFQQYWWLAKLPILANFCNFSILMGHKFVYFYHNDGSQVHLSVFAEFQHFGLEIGGKNWVWCGVLNTTPPPPPPPPIPCVKHLILPVVTWYVVSHREWKIQRNCFASFFSALQTDFASNIGPFTLGVKIAILEKSRSYGTKFHAKLCKKKRKPECAFFSPALTSRVVRTTRVKHRDF